MVDVPALQTPNIGFAFDPARSYLQAAQVKNALAQGQMNAFDLQDRQRKQDYQSELAAAPNDAARVVAMKKYDPERALQYASSLDEEARKKHAEDVTAMTDALGSLDKVPDEQLLSQTASTRAALQADKRPTAAIDQALQAAGNDPTKLRPLLRQQAQQGLHYKDQLAQQNSDRTFTATQENTKATREATAARDKSTDAFRQATLSQGQQRINIDQQKVSAGQPQPGAAPIGVVGHSEIDSTMPGYSSSVVGNTGLTQASIDQKALSYFTSGTLPPQGRTGVSGVQNAAISNRMAELGQNADLASNKSQLKSLTASLGTQQKYLDTTQRALNTANDTLDALQTYMKKNNINPSQFPDYNRFANFLKSKGIDPGTAGGYNAQIATLRQEYSQVLAKGGVRSVETDREAAKLIPDGLSPKDLAKVAAQIKVDSDNVVNDAQKQVSQIGDQINNIGKPKAAKAVNLPSGVTEEDISHTLKLHPEVTREQLLQKLGGK